MKKRIAMLLTSLAVLVAVPFAAFAQSPDAVAASGCSGGNHTHKVYVGTTDATRHHSSAPHPTYCQVEYKRYWQCSACNSSGIDSQFVSVWCPSTSIVDTPEVPEGPGLA